MGKALVKNNHILSNSPTGMGKTSLGLVIIGQTFSDYEIDNMSRYYFIGINKTNIKVPKKLIINNHHKLNQIATEQMINYTNWVYRNNSIWKKCKLIFEKKLSLFFLSDFSAKRNNIFTTYNDIINILLLKEIIGNHKFKKIVCVGIEKNFLLSLKSISKNIPIEEIQTNNTKTSKVKEWRGNIIFVLNILFVSFFNYFKKYESLKPSQSSRLLLTRFPAHFKNGVIHEDKYASFFKKNDRYATNILTDGMHQNVSLRKYFQEKRKIHGSKWHLLIDDYLRPFDIFKVIIYIPVLYLRASTILKSSYAYKGIDISNQVREELKVSLSRIWRLLFWPNAIRRFLDKNNCKSFVYYLHELPYGRLFSYILSERPLIKSIGFEHGWTTPRNFFYYLATEEGKRGENCIDFCPIPDKIIAESARSKQLYQAAYPITKITIMKKLYRLAYLDKIKLNKKKRFILIAGGLHDGQDLLNVFFNRIKKDKNTNYLFKPHPRAVAKYFSKYKLDNLNISYRPIETLYSEAISVIVSPASTIAQEANKLGIPVQVAHINGVVS